MRMQMHSTEAVVNVLEHDLVYYDKIIFFEDIELLPELCQSQAAQVTNQKLLILSVGAVQFQIENITFRYVSKEEIQQITGLYFMYEFTDKFLFVSRENANYASLYNLVDRELLSMEEVFEAILG